MMNLEPIDEFAEKAPDEEQLQAAHQLNFSRYLNARRLAVVIFFVGWGLVYIIGRRWISHKISEYLVGLGILCVLLEVLAVVGAAWFFLKSSINQLDIQTRRAEASAQVLKFPANAYYLLGCWLILWFFIAFVDNFGKSIPSIMPFSNNMDREFFTAFLLSMVPVVAGVLALTAAMRYCLATYTNTYNQHEQHDKVQIARSGFWIALRDFAIVVIVWTLDFDGYLTRKVLQIQDGFIYIWFVMALALFYSFCKLVGSALLWWEMRSRRYDGV